MRTRTEKAIILKVAVKPPVKAESLTIELSIIEVATITNRTARIMTLLEDGTAN